MVMIGATRVERRPAGRAGIIAGEVIRDANGNVAVATIDGLLIESGGGPNNGSMTRRFMMTLDASVKFIAALELNSNNIALGVVMRALGARTYAGAVNRDMGSG